MALDEPDDEDETQEVGGITFCNMALYTGIMGEFGRPQLHGLHDQL